MCLDTHIDMHMCTHPTPMYMHTHTHTTQTYTYTPHTQEQNQTNIWLVNTSNKTRFDCREMPPGYRPMSILCGMCSRILNLCMYTHIYINTYICVCVCVYVCRLSSTLWFLRHTILCTLSCPSWWAWIAIFHKHCYQAGVFTHWIGWFQWSHCSFVERTPLQVSILASPFFQRAAKLREPSSDSWIGVMLPTTAKHLSCCKCFLRRLHHFPH